MPDCVACQTHPRALFPDWDSKVKEAEAAGPVKCGVCGFKFFRTINMCPKCSAMATPETLLEVRTCNLELCSELMWFVNEWCKETGWMSPRVKTGSDLAFTIFAYPPKSNGEPDDDDSGKA